MGMLQQVGTFFPDQSVVFSHVIVFFSCQALTPGYRSDPDFNPKSFQNAFLFVFVLVLK
jgi:hypothetical protein